MLDTLKSSLSEWLDKKLIPEWRTAYEFASVKGLAVMGTLTTIWLAVPDSDRSALASMVGINPGYLIVAGLVVTLYQRLKKQPELHHDKTAGG